MYNGCFGVVLGCLLCLVGIFFLLICDIDFVKFFVFCVKGLEYLFVDELLVFGLDKVIVIIVGVNVEGELL